MMKFTHNNGHISSVDLLNAEVFLSHERRDFTGFNSKGHSNIFATESLKFFHKPFISMTPVGNAILDIV